MGYSTGSHTTFHHRYHLVGAPRYWFKVLCCEVRLRVRETIRQVCAETLDEVVGPHVLRILRPQPDARPVLEPEP